MYSISTQLFSTHQTQCGSQTNTNQNLEIMSQAGHKGQELLGNTKFTHLLGTRKQGEKVDDLFAQHLGFASVLEFYYRVMMNITHLEFDCLYAYLLAHIHGESCRVHRCHKTRLQRVRGNAPIGKCLPRRNHLTRVVTSPICRPRMILYFNTNVRSFIIPPTTTTYHILLLPCLDARNHTYAHTIWILPSNADNTVQMRYTFSSMSR